MNVYGTAGGNVIYHAASAMVERMPGERAQTLARLFNLREGLTAGDDVLPRRVEPENENETAAGG